MNKICVLHYTTHMTSVSPALALYRQLRHLTATKCKVLCLLRWASPRRLAITD